MDSQPLDSLAQVRSCIDDGRSFLLKGGAGSGKTHSLVDVFEYIYDINPSATVACITYTNTAVEEINSRYTHRRLSTSTIHTFIWDQIKSYKTELIHTLTECIAEGIIENLTDTDITVELLTELGGVSYGEYIQLAKGQISHDEMLDLAQKMYSKYPRLSQVTKSKYDFIFIDEYQDTHPQALDIIFNHVMKAGLENKLVVGLFGDPMQQIYDQESPDPVPEWGVELIEKRDNYRSCSNIVNKANNLLRYDSLRQDAVGGNKNFDGKVIFCSSATNPHIDEVARKIGWNEDYTALFLTHRLLAQNAGYQGVYDVYDKPEWALRTIRTAIKNHSLILSPAMTLGNVLAELRSQGIDANIDVARLSIFLDAKYNAIGHISKRLLTNADELCPLLSRARDVAEVYRLYDNNDLNSVFKKLSVVITSHDERSKLNQILQDLKSAIESQASIARIFDYVDEHINIFAQSDRYVARKEECPALYDAIGAIPFDEVIKLNTAFQEDSQHKTQHSAKGRAFKNVIVVLDNGYWDAGSSYENVFSDRYPDFIDYKSQRLVYTSASRAENNLCFYFYAKTDYRNARKTRLVLGDAVNLFGPEAVYDLDEIQV